MTVTTNGTRAVDVVAVGTTEAETEAALIASINGMAAVPVPAGFAGWILANSLDIASGAGPRFCALIYEATG
jgi:hypothetical protein